MRGKSPDHASVCDKYRERMCCTFSCGGSKAVKKIYFFEGCSAFVAMLVDIGMLMENKNINLCLSVCIYVCKGKLLSPFFMPTFRKDPSIRQPLGAINVVKVLQDSLPQNLFSFKKRLLWPMHVNTTICVDKGGEGERSRHVIGLGRERNVERDNREEKHQ